MKSKVFGLAIVAILSLLTQPSFAQSADLVASGGSASGTYTKFLNQAAQQCSNVVSVQVNPSTGSSENIDRLERNESSIGISQADALAYYGSKRDLSFVKTVAPLFLEQVYVIRRADLVKKVGGKCIAGHCFNQEDFTPQDFSQLAGMTVGAAGGAWVTANYLSIKSGVRMNIVQNTGSGDDVVAGVLAGKYDAGVVTGAAPLDTLTKLPADKKAQLTILPIPQSMMAQLSPPYTPATVVVPGMAQGGAPVQTVAITAVLVTQNYTADQPPAKAVSEFKKCLLTSAKSMASRVGTHPAWRGLVSNLQTSWPQWNDPYANEPAKPVVARRK